MKTYGAIPCSVRVPKGSSVGEIGERYKRWALYDTVTREDRKVFFDILPKGRDLTSKVEDELELVSGVVTEEDLRKNWTPGLYLCAQCQNPLYSSEDKWNGPCVWPSFRKEICSRSSIRRIHIPEYNGYKCKVFEVRCQTCDLFLGHAFDDGPEKGDTHVGAKWRH